MGSAQEQQQGKYPSSTCYVYRVLTFLTGVSYLSAYLLARVVNILRVVTSQISLLVNKPHAHGPKTSTDFNPANKCCARIQSLMALIPLPQRSIAVQYILFFVATHR